MSFSKLALTSLLQFLKYHTASSYHRVGGQGTAAALQAFTFVIATNGASACGFVSVRVCAYVSLSDPTPVQVGARKSLKHRGVPFTFLLHLLGA